jgi:hypothetical protein
MRVLALPLGGKRPWNNSKDVLARYWETLREEEKTGNKLWEARRKWKSSIKECKTKTTLNGKQKYSAVAFHMDLKQCKSQSPLYFTFIPMRKPVFNYGS